MVCPVETGLVWPIMGIILPHGDIDDVVCYVWCQKKFLVREGRISDVCNACRLKEVAIFDMELRVYHGRLRFYYQVGINIIPWWGSQINSHPLHLIPLGYYSAKL